MKLPEPAAHLADGLPLYSESQVTKLVRDALEAAAQVCDAQREASDASAAKAKGVKARDIYSSASQTAHWNAVVIRNMAKEIT